jgi:hypothetical protein
MNSAKFGEPRAATQHEGLQRMTQPLQNPGNARRKGNSWCRGLLRRGSQAKFWRPEPYCDVVNAAEPTNDTNEHFIERFRRYKNHTLGLK